MNFTGVVGRVVLCNWSPACTGKYRNSTLHATLSLTLTPCKSIQGGLAFQGDSRSFHTGITTNNTLPTLTKQILALPHNASNIAVVTPVLQRVLLNKYKLQRFMQRSVACGLFRRGRCKTPLPIQQSPLGSYFTNNSNTPPMHTERKLNSTPNGSKFHR